MGSKEAAKGIRAYDRFERPDERRGGQSSAVRARSGEGLCPPVWDHEAFKRDWNDAVQWAAEYGQRKLLISVAKSNYDMVKFNRLDVPGTVRVGSGEAAERREQGLAGQAKYTFSEMPTGDALLHFARALRPTGGVVCALNFANGEAVGGGYLRGARAQEEELCRQFPTLYTSLKRAKDRERAYPFGPCTCRPGRHQIGYADVLFTNRLTALRGPRAEGYRVLEGRERLDNMAVVTAAAPNVKAGEVFDENLVHLAIKTILAVPRQQDPTINTIVLGAWGCGAFGCKPGKMAELFARALHQDGMGRLYKEVHFAIPGGNENAKVFEETLCHWGLLLTRSPPPSLGYGR